MTSLNDYLNTSEIRKIVETSVPSAQLISATLLRTSTSRFRRAREFCINYIYRVQIRKPITLDAFTVLGNEPAMHYCVEELILKVRDHFWNRLVTKNEIIALEIIRERCPLLPVPRIIAHCAKVVIDDVAGYEWILMSKLPGTNLASLESAELEMRDRKSIMADLASILATFRSIYFDKGEMGSLVCIYNKANEQSDDYLPTLEAPWDSYLDYHRETLKSDIQGLINTERYAQNRHSYPNLEHFVSNKLPYIPVFAVDDVNVSLLTHGDLSTSNILVARPPPLVSGEIRRLRITGLLDWECAGFYSPFEEFVTLKDQFYFDEQALGLGVPNSSWTELLFKYLTGLGVSNPNHGFVQAHWPYIRKLYQLQEALGPLLLGEGVTDVDLVNAAATVAEIVHILS